MQQEIRRVHVCNFASMNIFFGLVAARLLCLRNPRFNHLWSGKDLRTSTGCFKASSE